MDHSLPTHDLKNPKPHLLLELLKGPEVALIVGAHGGLMAFAPLSDLGLQLRVLLLQLPHLLQVVGQAVVQELHGLLLMAVQGAFTIGPTASDVVRNMMDPWQGANVVAAVGKAEIGSAQRGGPHSNSIGMCPAG